MTGQDLKQILLEELHYLNSPGLIQQEDIPWPNGRAIPHVEEALFVENVPIAYFSRFSELDPDKITQLHKTFGVKVEPPYYSSSSLTKFVSTMRMSPHRRAPMRTLILNPVYCKG